MSKVVYNWMKVKPGDIISFRYKSKRSPRSQLQTILVLNPRINLPRKTGGEERYLIGIKLEEQNKIELRLTQQAVRRLERIGKLILFDEENKIYRLQIDEKFILNDQKGIKKRAFELISQNLEIHGQYRTYIYEKARRSSVQLEPIRIFIHENKL